MKRLLGAVLLGLVALPPPAAEGQAVGPAFRRVNPSVVIVRAGWKEAAAAGQVTRVAEVGSGVLITSPSRASGLARRPTRRYRSG
ncbi:MAG: hypothetical protein ACREJY_01885 [Candidatus Rokuibacteriota bacterium]